MCLLQMGKRAQRSVVSPGEPQKRIQTKVIHLPPGFFPTPHPYPEMQHNLVLETRGKRHKVIACISEAGRKYGAESQGGIIGGTWSNFPNLCLHA